MNTATILLFEPDSLIAVLWHFLTVLSIRLPVTARILLPFHANLLEISIGEAWKVPENRDQGIELNGSVRTSRCRVHKQRVC